MENNPEIALAWQFIENTGTHLFLTGKAGTGKTTFLRKLRAESPKRMIVLAPTGIAAINAGGVTIHSFFQVPFAPYVPESSFSADGKATYRFRYGKEKINIIRSIDLLVIDEISMVRADLLDSVDAVLRRFRDRNKPFGGVQLLMIGDLQQLSPVVKDDEWQMLRKYYDTPYFFSSQALFKIGLYSFHAGLLEHDLGYPGVISVVLIPPGQNPFILIIPGKKRLYKLICHLVSSKHTGTGFCISIPSGSTRQS